MQRQPLAFEALEDAIMYVSDPLRKTSLEELELMLQGFDDDEWGAFVVGGTQQQQQQQLQQHQQLQRRTQPQDQTQQQLQRASTDISLGTSQRADD